MNFKQPTTKFYEADIKRMQDVLENGEETQHHTLSSYKIYMKKWIEQRKKEAEAIRQGKPFIDSKHLSMNFFRAMGFVEYDRVRMTCQQGKEFKGAAAPLALKEKATAMGLPTDNVCDLCYKAISAIEIGYLPLEPLSMCDQGTCLPRIYQKLFIATKWAQPIFHFDVPPFENESCLEYIVDQLREFIEIAEKMFPGVIRYDEDKHIKYHARRENMERYNREIYEMLKHKPSPISGDDALIKPSWSASDPEYCRARRDEIAERVEKGFAAVPGEKLRVMWVGHIEWFKAYEVLAKWKISSPIHFLGPLVKAGMCPYWQTPAYYGGRELAPLEKEAARMIEQQFYESPADRRVGNLIRICRDIQIDGLVYLEEQGCGAILGLKRVIQERAEKELGIPTVTIEASSNDNSYVDEATITAQLDEFAQMLLSQKGLA